jgi:hypothetical protein
LTGSAASEILQFLTTWDTPEVERTLLAVARREEKRKYGARKVAIVLPWFTERKKPEAIPLMLNNLEENEVYAAVVGTKHAPYLNAIRRRLPDLQDGTLQGPALHRQRTTRHHAELILIVGEEADPVPKLMQFAENPENDYERQFAIKLLHKREDSRIVPWADALIRREQHWYEPFALIRLLGSLPAREADKVLIDLLDYDFRNVNQEMGFSTKSYHEEIVKVLEEKTRNKFGVDRAKWRDWLRRQSPP